LFNFFNFLNLTFLDNEVKKAEEGITGIASLTQDEHGR